MEYNAQEYIELLKESNYLKKQRKNLEIKKYSKLLSYGVQLSDYIHWKKKSQYLNLLKLFVNSTIDGETFVNHYLEIFDFNEEVVRNLEKDFKLLASVQLNLKSSGFTQWISELELCCDEFSPDFEPQDNVSFRFAKNEEQLRAAVANLIPQIEKYFDD